MSEESGHKSTIWTMKEALENVFTASEPGHEEQAKKPPGAARQPSGFATLDNECGGLPIADLSLVASRRHFDASALASQMALENALVGNPVLVFTAWRSTRAWLSQRLCGQAGVSYVGLRRETLTETDWGKLAHAVARFAEADLSLCFQRDLDALCRQARAWRRENPGTGLLLVDGLDWLWREPEERRREREVERVALVLKDLARELDLPLVASVRLDIGVGAPDEDQWALETLRGRGDLDVIAGLVAIITLCWGDHEGSTTLPVQAELMISDTARETICKTWLPYISHLAQFQHERQELTESNLVPDRAGPEPQEPDRRAFVACGDQYGLGRPLAELLHRELGANFSEEELLSHSQVNMSQRQELADILKNNLAAAWLGRIFLRKREEDGRWEWADLVEDGLLSMERERLIAVLFDGLRERDGFHYAALLKLMRPAKRLISWGDGAISNGDWLIKAPQALGVLSYEFDTEQTGRRTRPKKGYERILAIQERQPDIIDGKDAHGAYRLKDSGATLDAYQLDPLLAAFGATIENLQGIEFLAAPFSDAVLLRKDDQILAALMASNAEARRVF